MVSFSLSSTFSSSEKNPGFVQIVGSYFHARGKGRNELIYNPNFVNFESCMSIKLVANSILYLYKFGCKFKQCMHIYKFTHTESLKLINAQHTQLPVCSEVEHLHSLMHNELTRVSLGWQYVCLKIPVTCYTRIRTLAMLLVCSTDMPAPQQWIQSWVSFHTSVALWDYPSARCEQHIDTCSKYLCSAYRGYFLTS